MTKIQTEWTLYKQIPKDNKAKSGKKITSEIIWTQSSCDVIAAQPHLFLSFSRESPWWQHLCLPGDMTRPETFYCQVCCSGAGQETWWLSTAIRCPQAAIAYQLSSSHSTHVQTRTHTRTYTLRARLTHHFLFSQKLSSSVSRQVQAVLVIVFVLCRSVCYSIQACWGHIMTQCSTHTVSRVVQLL